MKKFSQARRSWARGIIEDSERIVWSEILSVVNELSGTKSRGSRITCEERFIESIEGVVPQEILPTQND